ncbi:lysophospholipid acyltransferase family protein [Porphyromonadaceae bacterium W3.11]|nr:lysophospholipid acyltransferase family protein [Porphyromonadaceae bacterium W3.11]
MKILDLLYKVYIIVVFIPLFVPLTLLTAFVSAVGCIVGGERIFSYWPGKIWSILTLYLLLCPVNVTGRENLPKNRCSIVTPNHTSALDIFLLYGYLGVRFKWVMKGSLRKLPFVGWACEKCGFIFVTHTPEGAIHVIEDTTSAIRKGYHIFIFPEGSRTKDGQLGPFRKGAFRVATDTRTPIVPVKIIGGYEAYSRYDIFPRPKKLTVKILPSIDTEKVSDHLALMKMTRQVILDA